MSFISGAIAIGKGALALGKYIAQAAPAVKGVVTSGILKAGGSAKVAQAVGSAAGVATAALITEGVDKLTDVTLKKLPKAGPVLDTIVDLATDISLIGGVLK